MSDDKEIFDIENMVTLSDVLENFQYYLDNTHEEVDSKRFNGLLQGMRNKYVGHSSRVEVPREYVGYEFAMTAYGYILENGGKREEALEYSREIHQKTTEWLDDVKNRPYYYTKKVVKHFDTHEEQKTMLKNGTMDKSAMMQKQSINQQLGRLSHTKLLSDKLEGLKQADEQQQKSINTLEKTVSSHELDLDRLKELTGLEELPPKHKAKILKGKGFTQKDVAEMVGKDVRTIKRWWKDL